MAGFDANARVAETALLIRARAQMTKHTAALLDGIGPSRITAQKLRPGYAGSRRSPMFVDFWHQGPLVARLLGELPPAPLGPTYLSFDQQFLNRNRVDLRLIEGGANRVADATQRTWAAATHHVLDGAARRAAKADQMAAVAAGRALTGRDPNVELPGASEEDVERYADLAVAARPIFLDALAERVLPLIPTVAAETSTVHDRVAVVLGYLSLPHNLSASSNDDGLITLDDALRAATTRRALGTHNDEALLQTLAGFEEDVPEVFSRAGVDLLRLAFDVAALDECGAIARELFGAVAVEREALEPVLTTAFATLFNGLEGPPFEP